MKLEVVLQHDADPKVFDEKGEDVTHLVRSITIHPHRIATASILLRDDDGNLQHLDVEVTRISAAGTWTTLGT